MKRIIYISIITVFFLSCEKEWLEERTDKRLVVPTTIEDFQALLDNSTGYMNSLPALGEIAVDDYHVKDERLQSLSSAVQRNAYIWKKEDLYEGSFVGDWILSYEKVLYANVALEGIETVEITSENQKDWNNVKGSALFFRALNFFHLAQLFAPPYDLDNAEDQLGIPLRLTSNVEEKTTRSTLQKTYDQIIEDLEGAINLLPETPLIQTRPSKPAALALLAKTYLIMEQYDTALGYANQSLEMYSTLMDYNEMTFDGASSFERYNPEVIFDAYLMTYAIFVSSYHNVDEDFYNIYDAADLRKKALFLDNSGDYIFKGSYGGAPGFAGIFWGGIATDEIWLIRAECLARSGQLDDAMNTLNQLAKNRYQADSFIPFSASSKDEALEIVLSERWKELPFRGIRFQDLRRLNKDSRFARTLTREVNGQIYELPPNDLRYTYPIPDDVIELSGIPQNPR